MAPQWTTLPLDGTFSDTFNNYQLHHSTMMSYVQKVSNIKWPVIAISQRSFDSLNSTCIQSWALHSSNKNLLVVLSYTLKRYGGRSFAHALIYQCIYGMDNPMNFIILNLCHTCFKTVYLGPLRSCTQACA